MTSVQVTDGEMKDIMSRRKMELEKKRREAKAKERAAAEAAEIAKRQAEEKTKRDAAGTQPEKVRVPLPENVPPPPLAAGAGKGGKGGKGKKGPPARGAKGTGKGKGKGKGAIKNSRWALPEIQDTTNTVWGSGGGVVLDESISGALMGLFQKKETDPASKSKPKAPEKKVPAVIDGRRAHRGGILLSQFRNRYADVRSSLLTADIGFLTLDRVNSLLEIVPSEQEVAQCMNYKPGTGERVIETAAYFQMVADIPRMEQRLHMLRMKHTFSTAIKELKEQIAKYIDACEQISCDQSFRRVLEVALELGNTFNGQKACGTQFTALLNFLGMKASNNSRITLLHYLASVLKNKMPELYDFHKSLDVVLNNNIRPENVIELEMRDLSGQIMLANEELGHVENQGPTIDGDEFYANIAGFCSKSADEMQAIEHLFELMQRRMYATTAYFGESTMSMDKLFEKLNEFLVKYKEAQSEHGRLIKNDMLLSMGDAITNKA